MYETTLVPIPLIASLINEARFSLLKKRPRNRVISSAISRPGVSTFPVPSKLSVHARTRRHCIRRDVRMDTCNFPERCRLSTLSSLSRPSRTSGHYFTGTDSIESCRRSRVYPESSRSSELNRKTRRKGAFARSSLPRLSHRRDAYLSRPTASNKFFLTHCCTAEAHFSSRRGNSVRETRRTCPRFAAQTSCCCDSFNGPSTILPLSLYLSISPAGFLGIYGSQDFCELYGVSFEKASRRF